MPKASTKYDTFEVEHTFSIASGVRLYEISVCTNIGIQRHMPNTLTDYSRSTKRPNREILSSFIADTHGEKMFIFFFSGPILAVDQSKMALSA